jgi:hypothetical protein
MGFVPMATHERLAFGNRDVRSGDSARAREGCVITHPTQPFLAINFMRLDRIADPI